MQDYGTTRISANLEELVRNEFFASQKQTPADVLPHPERSDIKEKWRHLSMDQSARIYEIDIIRFYEDIIIELQRELVRYKALAEIKRLAVEAEAEESFVPRPTVTLSAEMARKMRVRTRPGLRVGSE